MKVDALRCPACGATCHKEAKLKEPFQCASCGSTLVLTDLISGDQVLCQSCGAVNRDTECLYLRCAVPAIGRVQPLAWSEAERESAATLG